MAVLALLPLEMGLATCILNVFQTENGLILRNLIREYNSVTLFCLKFEEFINIVPSD